MKKTAIGAVLAILLGLGLGDLLAYQSHVLNATGVIVGAIFTCLEISIYLVLYWRMSKRRKETR